MNNKLRSAMIGGVVIGLLSGIPYVNLVNVFCCLWIIAGGALASYLYIKKSPAPVNIGEGAMIGALAGAIGMVVQLLVGVPLTILAGYPELNFLVSIMERVDPQRAEMYRQRVELILSRPFSEQFFHSVFSLGTLLNLLITVVFALIGGLIAIPLFEKRKADALSMPPPPPPSYDGTPGGAYAPPPPPPDTYGPEAK
jgi:hypothetical protein